MPEPRAFKDRPIRRVGVAALLAIAVHAVLIGAGAYLFGDYVFSDVSRPRLTQQRLDRAIADSPVIVQGNTIIDTSAIAPGEPESVTADWSEARMSLPAWSWWSWEADPSLSTPVVVPDKARN